MLPLKRLKIKIQIHSSFQGLIARKSIKCNNVFYVKFKSSGPKCNSALHMGP